MKIGFVLFENYHQRKDVASSRIRGKWIIEALNEIGVEAEEFVQGKTYDVIYFQKTYWKEMAREFKGVKILDICDPDWLDGAEVVSFCKDIDAVTVPTERLQKELSEMIDKPVHIIRDRENLELLPKPKKHEGEAKTVVWFGYSHNLDAIEPALDTIKKLGLTLRVITDGDFHTSLCDVKSVKWTKETEMEEIQKADFALLPEMTKGRWLYKSNNKTIHAWALGLPVAKTLDDLKRFIDPIERQKESELRLKEVKDKYDVKLSAKELLDLII
jgi:hypothetical protein